MRDENSRAQRQDHLSLEKAEERDKNTGTAIVAMALYWLYWDHQQDIGEDAIGGELVYHEFRSIKNHTKVVGGRWRNKW